MRTRISLSNHSPDRRHLPADPVPMNRAAQPVFIRSPELVRTDLPPRLPACLSSPRGVGAAGDRIQRAMNRWKDIPPSFVGCCIREAPAQRKRH
jgi:hypothetical protein